MARPARRDTPEPVKRLLRQEAGFGCCVCGIPIYQYHHIVPWESDQHFRPEDMMVLCPLHHDQATKHAMPEDEQRRYKDAPFNIRQGYVYGSLKTTHRYCAVDGGGILLLGDKTRILIDDEEVISLGTTSHQTLALSLTLYDQSDNLVAHVVHNEWLAGDSHSWDIESGWQHLTLRLARRRIMLRINARGEPLSLRGTFWRNGCRLDIGRDYLRFRQATEQGTNVTAAQLGYIDSDLRLYTGPRQELRMVPTVGGAIAPLSAADPVGRLVECLSLRDELRSGVASIIRGD